MDDSTELTPWKDINPPAARRPPAWAEQGERRWLSENNYVWRVTVDDVLTELTASLALVAPVGMTEEDRTQWLAVAMTAIAEKELSPPTFAHAVKRARLDPECDHPAKIVPTIMKAVGEGWQPSVHSDWQASSKAAPPAPPPLPPAPLTTDELSKAYARLGEPALRMALKFGEADEATCEAIRQRTFAAAA